MSEKPKAIHRDCDRCNHVVGYLDPRSEFSDKRYVQLVLKSDMDDFTGVLKDSVNPSGFEFHVWEFCPVCAKRLFEMPEPTDEQRQLLKALNLINEKYR